MFGPFLNLQADVFRAVVATDHLWFAAPSNDLIQDPDNSLGWQGEVNFDGQRFAVEIVNDIEQSDAPAIVELIVHEIHGPNNIDGLGHMQGFWLLAHQAFTWLDTQIELQFPIDPVHTLVVPLEPLDVA